LIPLSVILILALKNWPGKYATLILGVPGLINLPPSLGLKLFLLLAHVTAGYGFFLFVNKRIENKFITFAIGLAYAFSPYIFIRTIVGFSYSVIAYAVLPLFLLLYFQPKKNLGQYLLCALLLALIFSQLQAGVLTMLFLIINLICSTNKESVKNFLLTISSISILFLPWFIVGLITGAKDLVPTGSEFATLKFIADLPHSLRNVLMLSDHAVTSGFFYGFARQPIVMIGFAIIYLIASLSLFDRKNRPLVISLIISSILILPFSIGPTGKFSAFYTYVFNHFPQIALFRETYHFEFLFSFSLIFLFALGANQIIRWFLSNRLVSIGIKLLMIFATIIIIAPYFSFNYIGRFNLYQIPSEYRDAKNYLTDNKGFCTKAYYPLNLGFVYFKGDSSPDAANSDLIASALGIPYLTDGSSVLNTSNQEMFFRNRLTSQFLEKNDNGEVAALMNNGGVDCLIVRTDMDTKYNLVSGLWQESDPSILDKWNNKDLLGLAMGKEGLKLERQFGDKIFLFKINNQDTRNNNQINYNIQNPNIQTIHQYDNATILPITDWASEFDKYKEGWSRGRYAFWRKKIFADIEQDFIYTTREGSALSHQADEDVSGELIIRYLDGGTEGSFEIKIQDTRYKIQKNVGDEKFVVKNLGKINIKKGDKIEIKNISGENAIADIVLVN